MELEVQWGPSFRKEPWAAPPWEPGMDLMMSNQEELGLSHKGKKQNKEYLQGMNFVFIDLKHVLPDS